MIATCALAVFNSIVSFVGNLKNKEAIFRIITLAPDLTLFIISVVLQVKIIFKLNRRRGRVTAEIIDKVQGKYTKKLLNYLPVS